VTIGKHASIWFNTVIRGDMAPIRIGECRNIQDNSVIHVDSENPTVLGDNVSVGHGAIIHGAEVGSHCAVGVGARLLNGSRMGEYCIIGAGCVGTEGSVIPRRSVVLGIPGRVVKSVDATS
jgi:carbonic anhydrase/acetyltransferase-like protein (isoleucine patch superfamily)